MLLLLKIGNVTTDRRDQTIGSRMLPEDHEHRVVSRDGSEDLFDAQRIERKGETVRVSSQRTNDAEVAAEVHADVSADKILYVVLLYLAFLLFAWQRVIVSFDAFGDLAYFQQFQVARECRLGNDKALVTEVLEKPFLAVDAVRLD